MNTYIPNGKLLKNMGPAFVGSLTILTIFLMLIGNTTAQDLINNPFAGKVLYQTHCLRCHGSLGDGKGPDATTLMVPPRDFHTPESTARNEYELRSIIIWGLVFSSMHNWGHRLTPQEIRNLISYIRELAPYQPRI
jgi:mono/diheme cytochrome c family protein